MAELTKENLRALVEQYVHERIDELTNACAAQVMIQVQASKSRVPATTQAEGPIGAMEDELNAMHEAVAREDISPIVKRAETFLTGKGYEGFHSSQDFGRFCLGLVGAEGKFFRYCAATLYQQSQVPQTRADLLDFDNYNPPLQQVVSHLSPAPAPEVHKPLSESIEQFVRERKKHWKPETLSEYTNIFSTFFEIIGDVDSRSITIDMMSTYKKILLKLPRAWGRQNLYDGLSIIEIAQMDSEVKISPETINKHLTLISALMRWGIPNGRFVIDFAKGMRLRIEGNDERDRREVWDSDNLSKLFSPAYYPLNGPAHMFWLPILGLLTGARINELAQLRWNDVRQEDAVWVLSINKKDGKKVKNIQSIRLIPIHPFILEKLHFLDFVNSKRERDNSPIFNELYEYGSSPGKLASSHFSHFKKRELGINNPKINFHSFRHTACNGVDENIKEEIVNDFFGWKNKGVRKRVYRKKTPVPILFENIVEPMQIPDEYEFLTQSPWVSGGVEQIRVQKKKPSKERMVWK